MDYDEILLDAEGRMEKAVEHFNQELRGVRTGRANPGLLDGVQVEAYGTTNPLKSVANVSVQDARMLLVKPFDPSVTGDIEKAIQAADLGLNPQSDGKVIRLQIPPLSEERRKQLAGSIKDKAEETRISIRNVRRDANKHAQEARKDGDLTEDDEKRLQDDIQDLTKKYEGRVDERLKEKSEEIMSI